jgi:hypothetical protein
MKDERRELTEMDRDSQDEERAMKHSDSNAFIFHPAFCLYPAYPVNSLLCMMLIILSSFILALRCL